MVISGTDRNTSIKVTENALIIGNCERRPSANIIPQGSPTTIANPEITNVRWNPPIRTQFTSTNIQS